MGIFSLFGKKEENEEEKTVCEDCGKPHGDMKVLTGAAEELTDEIFPEAWKELKEDLKPKSKKEIAEQMFFLGAVNAMRMTQEMLEQANEELDELRKKENEYWNMSEDDKYKYLLTCEEEPDCEFDNFGMELEKRGDLEKAEKLYKKEAETYPEDFSGYENLGRLYKNMKKFSLAEHNLENALKLALQQKEEDPDCIDDEAIDGIRKELEDVKKRQTETQ